MTKYYWLQTSIQEKLKNEPAMKLCLCTEKAQKLHMELLENVLFILGHREHKIK